MYHQVQDQLKKDFEAQNAKKEKDYQNKLKELDAEKEQLVKDKESVQQQVENAVKTKLTSEKTKLEKSIRQQVDEGKITDG